MEHSCLHCSLTYHCPGNMPACMVPSPTHGTIQLEIYPHQPPRNIAASMVPSLTTEHLPATIFYSSGFPSRSLKIVFEPLVWACELCQIAFRCPPLRNPRPNDGSVCTVHQHCLYMNFCPRNEYAPISLYCSIRPFGLCVSVLYIHMCFVY